MEIETAMGAEWASMYE